MLTIPLQDCTENFSSCAVIGRRGYSSLESSWNICECDEDGKRENLNENSAGHDCEYCFCKIYFKESDLAFHIELEASTNKSPNSHCVDLHPLLN